ncbi:MAG TPA: transposase [Gemmataceae bacterium]|nr:transposase [Gemmataceae bacterium]
MPRAARRHQWTEAACYHVLNRGHDRGTLFHDADRTRFLELVARYRDRFGVRLYHYCLMGNHFHLLLQLPDPRQLSRVAAGLLVAYWHHYRRRYGLAGHLYQNRFKSPAIEADEYLLTCGRYIERNPVEARMAGSPWEYRWSSCRAHALGEADSLLSPNPWHEALSPDPARRRHLWREFLLGNDPKEEAVRRSDWVVGGEEFRRQMYRVAGRPAPRPRGRPRRGPKPN